MTPGSGHPPSLAGRLPADQPLAGRRVVVTRAAHQAGELAGLLAGAGADVALLPLLEVVPPANPDPLRAALARLGDFDWVVFTSANAVAACADSLTAELPVRVAVVGEATGRALAEIGVEAALVADKQHAEGLAEMLLPRLGDGARVLLPQAADARPVLADALARAGVELEAIVAYAKRIPPESPGRAAELFASGDLGWVTFTSPSTVDNFAEVLGSAWPRRRGGLFGASIGPVTSAALRRHSVEPAAEAAEPSAAGLVAAIVETVAP